MIKIQERTGITNKNNVETKITLTVVDQTALETADPALLCQYEVFSSHKTTINEDNALSPFNKNSGNRLLVYQFQE